MLSELFTEFDKMCLDHEVYKIYTIGDCYVVIGVVNANERNPPKECRNVVKFGYSLINIIKRLKKKIISKLEELSEQIS